MRVDSWAVTHAKFMNVWKWVKTFEAMISPTFLHHFFVKFFFRFYFFGCWYLDEHDMAITFDNDDLLIDFNWVYLDADDNISNKFWWLCLLQLYKTEEDDDFGSLDSSLLSFVLRFVFCLCLSFFYCYCLSGRFVYPESNNFFLCGVFYVIFDKWFWRVKKIIESVLKLSMYWTYWAINQ